MATGYFGETVLFGEDVIRYFTDKCQVQWTPGTGVNVWDGLPRRFTKSIGFCAWHLNRLLSFRKFTLTSEDGPIFDDYYNHIDFLHYLGVIGMDSVKLIAEGNYHIVDSNVLGMAVYLGRVIEDGTFQESAGWHGLATYAWALKLALIEEIFQVPGL